MTGDPARLPGLDLDRFVPWLRTLDPEVDGDVRARLLAGGRSNLTYAVSSGSREWVVRRPPLGHVLATAHDMTREYRVMSALHPTAVPVPRMYASCEDDSVIGAPFFVMQRCDGTPYRRAEELEALGPARTRTISERLIDTLTTLHQVDPVAVGLGDFGRAGGFLGRQVRRWNQQLAASHSRELPGAAQLYERLLAAVPPDPAPGIVHGDYRLDNVLFADDDRPTAVLDWEMATLGDPLTDLALLLMHKRLSHVSAVAVITASAAPGYLSEAEIVARYAAASDRDLSGFGFHLGLAAFKLAGILEGIHYRYLAGQTVGDGFGSVGAAVPLLLEFGLAALEEKENR